MALTTAHLDALVEAWATGATRVTFEGRTVEYRSQKDLEAAIARASAVLGVVSPIVPVSSAPRYSYTKHSRG